MRKIKLALKIAVAVLAITFVIVVIGLIVFGVPELGVQLKSGDQSTQSPIPSPTSSPVPTSNEPTPLTPIVTPTLPTLEGNQIILPYGQWVQYNQFKLRYISENPFPFPPSSTYPPSDYTPMLQISKSSDPDKEGGIASYNFAQGSTVDVSFWNVSINVIQENSDYLIVTIS